jgi:predicted nucleic acid-binding protein
VATPVLIDTNILVYTFDQNNPIKQVQAIQVLRALGDNGSGRLSVQCLSEFAATVTRRLRPAMSPADATVQVTWFQQIFPIFALTPMIVLEALRGVQTYQLSYYDAQIWASARLNQIPIVFSEDFNQGVLEGVRFVNPLAPDFKLEMWSHT